MSYPLTSTQVSSMEEVHDLCARDAMAADVMRELFLVHSLNAHLWPTEAQGNHTVVYQMVHDQATKELYSSPLPVMTAMVRTLEQVTQAPVNFVLEVLSRAVADPSIIPSSTHEEHLRRMIPRLFDGVPDATTATVYGLGVCGFAMSVHGDVPNGEDLLRQFIIDGVEHPAVKPVWTNQFVTGDARVWDMIQQKDGPVVYCTTGPDEPSSTEGELPIEDALVRLVAAANGDS